jgi:apolipoprotein N-acyltransferase
MRVTDELVRLGARALIVPTMDVVDWGRHQHELHARVAPVRAAEYGVPIFRLASSGISQVMEADGFVQTDAPMPGYGSMVFGSLPMNKTGSLPCDRFLAPACVWITGLIAVWLLLCNFRKPGTINPTPQP